MPGAPLVDSLDPYEILGLAERLDLDLTELQARYHARARAVHPDRVARRAPEERAHAESEAEALTFAYRTLRDPAARISWVLAHHGLEPRALPPADLAAEFFRLQGKPADAPEALAFRDRLQERATTLAAEQTRLMRAADAADPAERRGQLEALTRVVGEAVFVASMQRGLAGARP